MHAKLKGIRSLVCVSVTPISWRTLKLSAGKCSTGTIIISNLIVLDFWVKALFYSYGMTCSPQTLLWHIPDFPDDQPAHSESPLRHWTYLCNSYSFLQQNYVVNKYSGELAPSLARHRSYLQTTQKFRTCPGYSLVVGLPNIYNVHWLPARLLLMVIWLYVTSCTRVWDLVNICVNVHAVTCVVCADSVLLWTSTEAFSMLVLLIIRCDDENSTHF